MKRENIKDFYGRIIGTVIEEDDGRKKLLDFYGRILGTYDPRVDLTRDFYGRIISKGDRLLSLLDFPKNK